ncbi:MAG: preprotein translocase subunit YajC [Acidobacteria bacterium]|nr:preprotein translocase subunit YajC [Acidobacteriota bacterium]
MNALALNPAFLLQSASPTGGMLIPMIVMVGIFYLVLFLPMRRRQRKLDDLLSNLKSGDKVVTNAGLIGVITGLTDKTVTLRVKPDNVKIEFARTAVNGIAEEEDNA